MTHPTFTCTTTATPETQTNITSKSPPLQVLLPLLLRLQESMLMICKGQKAGNNGLSYAIYNQEDGQDLGGGEADNKSKWFVVDREGAAETLVQSQPKEKKEVLEEQTSAGSSRNRFMRRGSTVLSSDCKIQLKREQLKIERKAKLQRLDALAAKRLNDEFEMSEQQRKRAAEVQQQA
ncbi:hypothetical protein Tco_0129197 [Tanacetum coccineum]